jgi:FkbM family methyltransferase
MPNGSVRAAVWWMRERDPIALFCAIARGVIMKCIGLKRFPQLQVLRARSKTRYVEKEIVGNKMYLDLKDPGISSDLLRDGIREPFLTESIQKEIKEGDVIVDIGANIGYYALQEARLVGDKGRVYAIEPVPENVELLKKNIELNNYSNIEVFQLAVGAVNKTDYVYISNCRNTASMIKTQASIDRASVQVTTLDKFLENKPSPNLIRMDVEGYEVEIVKGMTKLLEANKPLKLIVELHPLYYVTKEKRKDFLKALKESRFQVKWAIYEPYPASLLSEPGFVRKAVNAISQRANFRFGYVNVTIDDLLSWERVSFLEVLFERE